MSRTGIVLRKGSWAEDLAHGIVEAHAEDLDKEVDGVAVEIALGPAPVAFLDQESRKGGQLEVDYHVPKELTGNGVERWKLEFEDTEAGQTWFRDQYSYDFKVAADGTFTIPEVLPGKYSLLVNVAQGYLGSGLDSKPRNPGEDPQIASRGMKIEVPDASGDSKSLMDLGEITLSRTH